MGGMWERDCVARVGVVQKVPETCLVQQFIMSRMQFREAWGSFLVNHKGKAYVRMGIMQDLTSIRRCHWERPLTVLARTLIPLATAEARLDMMWWWKRSLWSK